MRRSLAVCVALCTVLLGVGRNADAQGNDFITEVGDAPACVDLESVARCAVTLSGDWLAYTDRDLVGHVVNLGSGARIQVASLMNQGTGFGPNPFMFEFPIADFPDDTHMVWEPREVYTAADLNGDGDLNDYVLHTLDLTNLTVNNLRVSTWLSVDPPRFRISRSWVVTSSAENRDGRDYNDDGDTEDNVVFAYHLPTEVMHNLGDLSQSYLAVVDDTLVYLVRETTAAQDLNGDGDRDDDVLHIKPLPDGAPYNTRLAAGQTKSQSHAPSTGGWLSFQVVESGQKLDLNQDGDTSDRVGYLLNIQTLALRNLGHDQRNAFVDGSWAAIGVKEASDREDLNGDGDLNDFVYVFHQIVENRDGPRVSADEIGASLCGELFTSLIREKAGQDLNGDGDSDDAFLQVTELDSGQTTALAEVSYGPPIWADCSGVAAIAGVFDDPHLVVWDYVSMQQLIIPQGTDRVVSPQNVVFSDHWVGYDSPAGGMHVIDRQSGHTFSLGVTRENISFITSSYISNNWYVFMHEGSLQVADLSRLVAGNFCRGDVNSDGAIDISDPISLLLNLFAGGSKPACEDAADANDDGAFDISDAVFILRWLFQGHAAPPSPGPTCGPDPTDDALSCALTACVQ